MFKIDDKKTIHINRGDIGCLKISAKNYDGTQYEFQKNDVIRFGIFSKGNMNKLILQKDIIVESNTTEVELNLTMEDTRIGEIINKPVSYWYEIQLNPDTNAQTIIGYDTNGAKIFKLYPEGVEQE